jgi:hypothetical protein
MSRSVGGLFRKSWDLPATEVDQLGKFSAQPPVPRLASVFRNLGDPTTYSCFSFHIQAPSCPHTAHIPNAPAQPAMGGIGIQPRVPQERYSDLRDRDRQGKAVHPNAQPAVCLSGTLAIRSLTGRAPVQQRSHQRSSRSPASAQAVPGCHRSVLRRDPDARPGCASRPHNEQE